MASIQKTSRGYRAFICVRGERKTACFRTRREADAWAAARETMLREETGKPASARHTLREALERYRDEESPKKRGGKWEYVRINVFLRSPMLPVDRPLIETTTAAIAAWRDSRRLCVEDGTVRRELGLLASILETARREWKWLSINPARDAKKPPPPEARDRVISRAEIRAMLRVMGHSPRQPVRSVGQAVAVCFLAALRTGMRAGELTGLTWDRVCADFCRLPVTKTKSRNVPLPAKSMRVIERMRGWDGKLVFGLDSRTLDALFRKYRARAGLEGFRFHDARHTAATWLARKIDVLDLCKVFGWANPKTAMVYYNPTASEIARRMR